MLEQRIEQDLKAALLAGDKVKVMTLRGLKSSLLYAKVAAGKREAGLSDDEVVAVLSKEAKKRQESAELYRQGGSQERADAELAEKSLIEVYLPAQLSEEEISKVVDEIIQQTGVSDMAAMGQVIGIVRQQTQGAADGAVIARLVKQRLGQ